MKYVRCLAMLVMGCMATTAVAQVQVVRDGAARAVVVTAADPSPVAAYAAQEFVEHVEKATGQRLTVVTEANIPEGFDSRIYIGMTDAARNQGIDAGKLEIEQSVIRSVGGDLYIIGKEIKQADYKGTRPHAQPWNPMSNECEYSGTLYGVYEVLEQNVGVRWLWPGELGTYVPKTDTLEIAAVDKTVKPKLQYRDMGDWALPQCGISGIKYGAEIPFVIEYTPLTEEIVRTLIYPTVEAGHEYGKAMWVYQRRHRRFTPIEHPTVILATHTIAGLDDWWAKYGATHPEWFTMQPNGQRGLKSPRSGPYTPMCVSNAELHKAIVAEWDGGDVLTLGEVDAGGDSFCQCDNCKAWDGPQPTDYPAILANYKHLPRAIGGRYAKYWKAVYDLAVQRNPNVKISGYLYHNTLPAPTEPVDLNRNIHAEFVIYGGYDGWYPMSKEEDQWYRDTWKAWSDAGVSLIYGPNCLLANYVTPNLTTTQAGEFIRFAYQNGMIGANLRAFTFSWSVHGPMAYMYYKLLEDPELEIADIRQEYFSAFGPAAKQVEEYFNYWEDYARTRPVVGTPENGDEYGAIEKLRRARGHYLAYPPAVFVPAEEMLAKALATAKQDPSPEFAQRVEFLQAGLVHAQLALKIHDFIDYDSPMAQLGTAPTDPERLKQARAAMQALIRFRADPKNRFVADYYGNALTEQAYIRNIEALIDAQEKSGDYVPEDAIY